MENNTSGFLMEQYRKKLEKFCAFQERCISEIKIKLEKIKVPHEFWEPLISYLVDNNFVNEERFTEIYVRSKINQKGWGPLKIKMELRKKQVNDSLINKYLLEFQNNDREELLNFWLQKKLKSIKNDNRQNIREKLIRFGISKGFETDKVVEAVNKIIKAQPED